MTKAPTPSEFYTPAELVALAQQQCRTLLRDCLFMPADHTVAEHVAMEKACSTRD